jgi:thioredoxin 1
VSLPQPKFNNTSPDMKQSIKILIVIVVIAGAAGVLALKQNQSTASASADPVASTPGIMAVASDNSEARAPLPRLVDLGAERCIPCRMMAPILEELKRDYADSFHTVFIDVWKNPEAGKAYGVEMIPTQIFYDAEGQERFRHVGFYGKEDILAKWEELGVNLRP